MRYSARWPSTPRSPRRDPAPAGPDAAAPLPSNAELAAVFHEIGSLLEIKGELVFKTVAYHRAADAIAHSPPDIARAYREGRPPPIPGVGTAISDKIAELVATGRLGFLERLHGEVPATLVELLEIPGVGPKTVRLLWSARDRDARGPADGPPCRDAARRAGPVREGDRAACAPGWMMLDRRSSRMTLGPRERLVTGVAALLADVPGVRTIVPAGSFRRRRETIGDLDLLVETDDPAAVSIASSPSRSTRWLNRGRTRPRSAFGRPAG